MWDIETVIEAIRSHGQVAAEALAAIQIGTTSALNPEGLKAVAETLDEPYEEVWAGTLERRGLLGAFVLAMQARGVAIEAIELPSYDETQWDDEKLKAFIAQASAFRCQILTDQGARGSGVLVGPSSVLTAWHVIAMAPPVDPQRLAPSIEVRLASGKCIPAKPRYGSPCGDQEIESVLPKSDDEIVDRNDLVLLSLREPAGLHLSFATLPPEPCACRDGGAFVLIHYPEGTYRGLAFGTFERIRKVTGRWGHSILNTAPGSSGGACFDTRFLLAGLHQGRRAPPAPGGRLVPTIRFADAIRDHLARDETPDSVWSLDGTVTGELVVGREAFFHGYAAAMRGPARVRGLWIQRTDPRNDVSGLPFSYRLLDRMVARSPGARLVAIRFDELVRDLPDEIARRVTAAGFPVEPVGEANGVGAAHTEPEAMIADRGRRLAQAIDAAARARQVRLWLFFDHPRIIFGDEHRWALSAFLDQALRLDGLRLAMAGYEAMQLPGARFRSRAEAEDDGMPGFYVEYLTGFGRLDVENLIGNAAKALERTIGHQRVQELATEALDGMKQTNGVFFESWMAEEVGKRLRPELGKLAAGSDAS